VGELDLSPDAAPRSERALAGVVGEQLGDARDAQAVVVGRARDEEVAEIGGHQRGDRVHAILAVPGELGELAHGAPQHEAARAEVAARVELEPDGLKRRCYSIS
jgi:hypothetical protein